MKNKYRIILSCLACLIIGATGGYFTGRFYGLYYVTQNAFLSTDMVYAKHLNTHIERAYQAYLHQPPEVGVWALEGLEKEFIEIRSKEPESLIFSKRGTTTDLMLTHGRLIKLYTSIGNTEKAKFHEFKAIEYATELNPDNEQLRDINFILEFVAKFDKKSAKVE